MKGLLIAAIFGLAVVVAALADMRPSERSTLRSAKSGVVPAGSISRTELATAVQTQLDSGTNAQARVAQAEIDITNRYTKAESDSAFSPKISAGTLLVVNTTQLVFVASGVTNVVDADITN